MEKIIIELTGEIITKKVSPQGKKKKCGRVYVPKDMIGHNVIIIKRERKQRGKKKEEIK